MYTELSDEMMRTLRLESFPIAIAFSTEAPEGVEQMNGRARLCQMLDRVRFVGESFATVSECHECDGGANSCGLRMMSPNRKTGEFLVKLGLFGSRRAARRFLSSNPRVEFGTVQVVSFAPLGKAPFEPDVVLLVCNAAQGMRIAEAFAYDSGKKTTGLTGPPICSAVVAAPFLTGEVTYSLGDAGARKYMKLKDEDLFVAIPAELLPGIVANLGKAVIA
jgi:uncharacterized protein (DUF169 family)